MFGKYSNIPEKLLATPPHRLWQPLQWSTPFFLNRHTRPAPGGSGNWSIMVVSSSQALKVAGPRHPSPLYRVCTEHHCRSTNSLPVYAFKLKTTTAKPKTHQTYQPHLGPENNKSRTQINRQSQLPDPCPSAITFYTIHNELYTAKQLNSKLLPISLIKVFKIERQTSKCTLLCWGKINQCK